MLYKFIAIELIYNFSSENIEIASMIKMIMLVFILGDLNAVIMKDVIFAFLPWVSVLEKSKHFVLVKLNSSLNVDDKRSKTFVC